MWPMWRPSDIKQFFVPGIKATIFPMSFAKELALLNKITSFSTLKSWQTKRHLDVFLPSLLHQAFPLVCNFGWNFSSGGNVDNFCLILVQHGNLPINCCSIKLSKFPPLPKSQPILQSMCMPTSYFLPSWRVRRRRCRRRARWRRCRRRCRPQSPAPRTASSTRRCRNWGGIGRDSIWRTSRPYHSMSSRVSIQLPIPKSNPKWHWKIHQKWCQ